MSNFTVFSADNDAALLLLAARYDSGILTRAYSVDRSATSALLGFLRDALMDWSSSYFSSSYYLPILYPGCRGYDQFTL